MGAAEMKRLAAEIARIEDDALARLPTRSVDVRIRDLRDARSARVRARARARIAMVSILAVVAAIALVVARPRPLRFEVGPSHETGVLGARVEAATAEPVPVHFSDGTELVLSTDARARVVSLATNGAQVVVERGTVHAAVVPRRDGAWVFAVGPFDVHVKGTRFVASWDPVHETFALRMEEGLVVVTSACLPAPRSSVAGEVLALSCAHPPSSPPPDPSAALPLAPPPPSVADAVPARVAPPALPPVAAPQPQPSTEPEGSRDAATTLDWRTLLARGETNAALGLAESNGGFDDACAKASIGDLMVLGDAARLAGRSTRAVQVYRAVRARFPGEDEAAVAAFHLGQVAFDRGGTMTEARNGFASYLAERPNGALAQEALGRLLEVEQRDGRTVAAKALAQRYLSRFPSGPHAERAHAVAALP